LRLRSARLAQEAEGASGRSLNKQSIKWNMKGRHVRPFAFFQRMPMNVRLLAQS
jgi:hypothetical protein